MTHINLGNDHPGLLGLLAYSPRTARPMLDLVETLLEGDSPMSKGERELIGSLVSQAADCQFCTEAHGAFAATSIDGGGEAVSRAQADPQSSGLSPRMQALVDIALATERGGHDVTDDLLDQARSAGVTDREIHDTVLIASMFAMFTRYVDGLATVAPDDAGWYQGMAEQLSQGGYAGMAAMLAPREPTPA